MSKKQNLEKQLQDCKSSEEHILSKLKDCLKIPNEQKVKLYDRLIPLVKTHLEQRLRTGDWDWFAVKQNIAENAVKFLVGEDAFSHLEKV